MRVVANVHRECDGLLVQNHRHECSTVDVPSYDELDAKADLDGPKGLNALHKKVDTLHKSIFGGSSPADKPDAVWDELTRIREDLAHAKVDFEKKMVAWVAEAQNSAVAAAGKAVREMEEIEQRVSTQQIEVTEFVQRAISEVERMRTDVEQLYSKTRNINEAMTTRCRTFFARLRWLLFGDSLA